MAEWKLTAYAGKAVVQAALVAHEEAGESEAWPAHIVLVGSEVAEDRPDDWVLDAYLPDRPTPAEQAAVAALFSENPPGIVAQELPETDWLSATQAMVAPIRADRFHVHTPDYPADANAIDLIVPAAQAFGTGQHATTAGCLTMLSEMRRRGTRVRRVADIGTGTGLLAFAALRLWPGARAVASDIDAVCEDVVAHNAVLNGIPLGNGRGQVMMVTAAGMDHPVIAAGAPYDLLIANILAGPLIELAGDFADAVTPGGSLLLAGLLERQEAAVRAAYRTAGFRLAARLVNGDWSILWLRRRR